MLKKIITCLLFLLMCKISFAEDKFKCEIEDFGDVNLTYTYSPEIKQKLKAKIGVEKWSAPFVVREKCEKLKFEIINFPEERWGEYECEHEYTTVAKKYIFYKLTEKGKSILAKPWQDTLMFIPESPLLPYFEDRIVNNSLCEPY